MAIAVRNQRGEPVARRCGPSRQQSHLGERWFSKKTVRRTRRARQDRRTLTLFSAKQDASSWLPQNPVGGLRKIFRNEIRLYLPFGGIPGNLALPVAGAHEDAA